MQLAGFQFLLAAMFFISGFCALLYQTVWLRLAFAHFGVITPVVSVVVSTFMLGLGLGSWLAGSIVSRLDQFRIKALVAYGITEIFIGSGAFLVPLIFNQTWQLLLTAGETNSAQFLIGSGFSIALGVLPFAIAMGATYPIALSAYRQFGLTDNHRFGFLYAFNTAGAVAGCAMTVFTLIEWLGFQSTLMVGAALNLTIGITAILGGYCFSCKRVTN